VLEQQHEIFSQVARDLRACQVPLPLETRGIRHPSFDRNQVYGVHSFTSTPTFTEPLMDR
jgi:hypothetical protein